MTEQGAASLILDAAVEPREAQRPTSLAARTPIAATPGDRAIAVGAMADREVRPAGSSPAVQGSRCSLAPPGAPSPYRGEGKREKTGPDVSKQPAAERWLKNAIKAWMAETSPAMTDAMPETAN